MAKDPSPTKSYPTDSYLITKCALLKEFNNFPKSLRSKRVDFLIPLYPKDIRVIGFIGNRLEMEWAEDDHGIPVIIFKVSEKITSAGIAGIQSGKQAYMPESLWCDILLGILPETNSEDSGLTAVCFSKEEFEIVINKFYVIDNKHYIPYDELGETVATDMELLVLVRFIHKPVIQ